MAEQIPLAALGFVLENLKQLILHYSKLRSGLDENVNTLLKGLESMKAFAIEYTKKDTENKVLLNLGKDVRKMVEDTEDAIEEYIILQANKRASSLATRTVHLFDFSSSSRRDLLNRIEQLSADVRNFIERDAPLVLKLTKYEAEAAAAAAAIGGKNKKKKKAPVAEEDDVVGFVDEAEKVIKLLTGEAKELEIISIIGMLGLGKTTLAKKVLKDPKVEYEFFYSVFVNVSREYKKREVFINILRALKCEDDRDEVHEEKIDTVDEEEKIIKKLCKELGKNKYLIVLDDVWDKAAWDDLKDGFPDNKKGSRVLITSRDIRVASHENPSKSAHQLRFMRNDESQELLRRKVFGKNELSHHLVPDEVHILKVCGGLPLAIVVVAGILWNQRDSTHWWDQVAKSVGDHVTREQSQIYDMIKLSLEPFPYHQKACFLYLGVFREEFDIPVWKLLRLWIAEGFIQKVRGMTLEDIAEEYLQDLVDRSLLIVVSRRSNGDIKTCRIHDTLRDFCKNEAPKQNLFQEIKMADQSTYLMKHHRRICVNSNVKNYMLDLRPTDNRVCSFLTFAKDDTRLHVELVSSIPKAFGRLRVLDANPLKFPRFPAKLVGLVLLKYIAMSIEFNTIPPSFSSLTNLETVVIDTTHRTLDIKADISKLALLRHLQTNAATSLHLEKGKATAAANPYLQTLCTISPASCTEELFERYPNLKKLGISGDLAIIILNKGDFSFFESLAKKESLENLKLVNDGTTPLDVLPRETSFPRYLRRLTLAKTFLDWSKISTLGKLQQLEVLKLKENAFDGELWNTEGGGFRCLKVLHIVHTQKLILWQADASHFPMLTSLYLRQCANLTAIPNGIGDIPSLQMIDVFRCDKSSVAHSARKIQVLKLQQAQQKNDKNPFKLSVYPPDQ